MYKTDYLVVGAGASGLAFVDTLLDHTDAEITLVDRRDNPGGHWNDAYPFVQLHQPSSFYGVASSELSSFHVDQSGFNQGLEELATGQEVTAYFHKLVERKFLPSGRVRFLRSCSYADHKLEHAVSGTVEDVEVREKLVDATFCENVIPLTHKRNFDVAGDVTCVPPNEVPKRAWDHDHFTVLGGGKTAMDTVLWLLDRGADSDQIRWVVPRDGWLLNRVFAQPDGANFARNIGGFADFLDMMVTAQSTDDFAARMEASGQWMRLSKDVEPRMMHGATVTRAELEALRGLSDILRLGRVVSIYGDEIQLAAGRCSAKPGSLYVDCTASALAKADSKPVFEEDRLTIQMIRMYQPTFSSAVLARIEALDLDTAAKNALAEPVPMTDTVRDWIAMQVQSILNQGAWNQVDPLRDWLGTCRLDGFQRARREVDRDDTLVAETFARIRAMSGPAIENARKLLRH